jgi:hypothetical protein
VFLILYPREHLEHLWMKIILRWILEKKDVVVMIELIWHKIGIGGGPL